MIQKLKSENLINSEKLKPVIGFAGLTHLGLNTAVASAAHGFMVVGFHDDPELVSQLNKNKPHVLEPGLPELLSEHKEKLTFSSDSKALADCDIVYIAVDVPTDDNGSSNLTSINLMLQKASAVMNKNSLLIILCQVSPGYTRQVDWPASQLYYQVETLIFGRAVERAMYPERFIIGCSDPQLPLPLHLNHYLKTFNCPILPMRYESAELAKISINMCLVASVSTANTLAEICEHIGADWSEIIPALRLDKRIGQFAYLTPGLGISGGNLERDLNTVLRYSEKHKTDGGVVASWVKNSRYRKNWAWDTFKKLGLDKKIEKRVAVLGITYKENTHSVKNSPSLVFLSHFSNCEICGFDPAASHESTDSNVIRTGSAIEAIKGADVLVILTPWSEFRMITPEILEENMNGRVVIDPYGMLNGISLKSKGFIYATLGRPIL
jgi:UDPglucose 6-dehydrogenase